MYLLANANSPVGAVIAVGGIIEEQKNINYEKAMKVYEKDPSPELFFKLLGFKNFKAIEEHYEGAEIEGIKKHYEWILKMKKMDSDERVEYTDNTLLLQGLNEMSVRKIKNERDRQLLEVALFHKHKWHLKESYRGPRWYDGMVNTFTVTLFVFSILSIYIADGGVDMYLIAPIASPLGVLILWQEMNEEAKIRAYEEAEELYFKDPSSNIGHFFKRNGWSFAELKKEYDNKTEEDIKKQFDEYLRVKGLPVSKRVEHFSNPELLQFIQDQPYAAIKERRDYRIMEMTLFHKHRKKIAAAYGIKFVNKKQKEQDKDLNRSLLFAGIFLLSIIGLITFSTGGMR